MSLSDVRNTGRRLVHKYSTSLLPCQDEFLGSPREARIPLFQRV